MKKISYRYLGIFFIISGAYSSLWYHSWYLPVSFAVIDNTASWFLPAGYRFAAFLFAPKRYWLAIIIGEWTAIILITNERGEIPALSNFIATTFPALFYLCAAHFYLKLYRKPELKTTHQVFGLIMGAICAATLTSVTLTTSMIYHNELATIPKTELFTQTHLLNATAFAFGDIVGVLLILPLSILLVEIYGKKKPSLKITNKGIFKISFSLALSLLAILNINQIPLYYIKILSVTFVIAASHKWGWKGATLSVFAMCILVVYTALRTDVAISVIENQAYLITIAFTALILGAAITQQKSANTKLQEQNSALNRLNTRYKEQAKKNQLLATKVVEIQELERKKISTELHDDIGQTLTAIRTEITILEQLTKDKKVLQSALNLRALSNKVYNVTRNLIILLHPRELNDLGLQKALQGRSLTKLLDSAGINYHLNIASDLDNLSEDKKIAIYRIIQESFNNIVKHAAADNVYVDLSIKQNRLRLSVKDDGKGFETKRKEAFNGGFGLLGIEERALALKGSFQVDSSGSGTHLLIQLPAT
ncbi:MASE1 domain-containing protein [Pseudoalteromonas sp. T1lg75]|uniref:MASE1 domain-containing protein n=1 Tax=Pseudoalteromonas sp. T1lg75 TaxID=2077102 RepID=UPI000CF69A2A|nr:MASE1 domain-containing protein [Pseudoalteromonas sp. T1lg75]